MIKFCGLFSLYIVLIEFQIERKEVEFIKLGKKAQGILCHKEFPSDDSLLYSVIGNIQSSSDLLALS